MKIYRNGSNITGLKFSDHQLSAWSLAEAAYDGQIGTGTLVLPGIDVGGVKPVAGDRYTILGDDNTFLYMGFVADHHTQRNPGAPLEYELLLDMVDTNRQLIGRELHDYTFATDIPAGTLMSNFISTYLSDLTLDTSHVWTSLVPVAAQTFSGDGITNVLAQLIMYTGYTAFMVGLADNSFAIHWHPLAYGIPAGLSISDVAADVDGVTVFAPQLPIANYISTDIKNYVYGVNSVGYVVAGGGPNQHNNGGLRWQAYLMYGVNADSLTTYVNTVLDTQATESANYTCSIGPLTEEQVALVPPGSDILVTCGAWGLTGSYERVTQRTLRIANEGQIAPNHWYLDLQLAMPQRQPTAATGYGGTGGSSGALIDMSLVVDHVGITQTDLAPAVGEQSDVSLWLANIANQKVPIDGVTIYISVETDPAGGTDYSVHDASLVTDIFGSVSTYMTHVTAGPSTRARVNGSL